MDDGGFILDRRRGLPQADAERVAALQGGIDLSDASLPAAYGEKAARDLTANLERLLSEVRTGDLGECVDMLRHVRSRLGELTPASLTPRRGLAGLFDSRGRRLKRFRAVFSDAAQSLTDGADEIMARGHGVRRRIDNLDRIMDEVRGQILEVEAHVAAGLRRLAEPLPDGPVRMPELAEDDPALEEIPTVEELAAAFARRIRALAGLASGAVRQLPLTRVAQNADWQGPERLTAAAGGLHDWATAWREGLGLTRRRPRRIRPDVTALERDQASLHAALEEAERFLAAARARRAETEARMTRVAEDARRAFLA